MSNSTAGGEPPKIDRSFFNKCKEVNIFCPIEATVLAYYPNLGSSIFFTVSFGLLTLAAGYLCVTKRTWTYGAAITSGLLLETMGYIGRIMLYNNPWDKDGFQLQICTIILAPTLICVSIYLTLKHVALALNPDLSRFAPKWYPRIFLPADLTCLVVQAIGGGLAAAAGSDDQALSDGGNNAIIAGIVLQVLVLAGFGLLGSDYFFRVRKYMASPGARPAALAVWRDVKFRRFAYAVGGAYACIIIRCIYRIAEMAGGWGNHIMQDEPSFLVLDSTLVLVATTLLTVFHPGFNFPQMRNGYVYDGTEGVAQDEENKATPAIPQGETSESNHEVSAKA